MSPSSMQSPRQSTPRGFSMASPPRRSGHFISVTLLSSSIVSWSHSLFPGRSTVRQCESEVEAKVTLRWGFSGASLARAAASHAAKRASEIDTKKRFMSNLLLCGAPQAFRPHPLESFVIFRLVEDPHPPVPAVEGWYTRPASVDRAVLASRHFIMARASLQYQAEFLPIGQHPMVVALPIVDNKVPTPRNPRSIQHHSCATDGQCFMAGLAVRDKSTSAAGARTMPKQNSGAIRKPQ